MGARAFFYVFAGLLCLAGALLPAATRAQAPPYLTQWGGLGTGDGQFYYPVSVAVDGSGHVYVADYNVGGTENHRVQEFTSTGAYLRQWGTLGSGNGQFYNPGGVAADGSGHVYVGDTQNHRIQTFASDGA